MLDSNTVKDVMVFTSCNICGCKEYQEICDIKISPILKPSRLVKCKECGFFYANPRLKEEDERDYYKKQHYKDQEKDFWYEGRIDFFKRSLGEIKKFLKNGNLLDIGCGMGYFMDLARSYGWKVKGVDVSDYAVEYARKELGLNVIKGDVKDAQFETEYFDVVTMWNVLDQLYDPKGNLIELNRILKKGGFLFVRISNLYFHLKLFKFYNRLKPLFKYIGNSPAIFHLYSFDKNSIRRLLKSVGFSKVIVKIESVSLNNPRLLEIFGKGTECLVRKLLNFGTTVIYFLSFRKILFSPSIFVIAQKKI